MWTMVMMSFTSVGLWRMKREAPDLVVSIGKAEWKNLNKDVILRQLLHLFTYI